MSPTSPLEIIPIPTLIPLVLSLRKNHAGSPHPKYFVDTAIAIMIALNIKTSRLIPRKST